MIIIFKIGDKNSVKSIIHWIGVYFKCIFSFQNNSFFLSFGVKMITSLQTFLVIRFSVDDWIFTILSFTSWLTPFLLNCTGFELSNRMLFIKLKKDFKCFTPYRNIIHIIENLINMNRWISSTSYCKFWINWVIL